MNGLTSFDTVYVALLFIVPGYVYYAIRGQLVAGHRARGNEAIVRLVCVSCVNFVFSGWYVYLTLGDPTSSNAERAFAWTFCILICPALLGLASGASNQFELSKRIYKRLRLKHVHVVPTSWDFAFSGREACYVIVTLQEGGRFAGIWCDKSFAADEPSERDLYLEDVYEIGKDDGPWVATDRSVLIKSQEIRYIEFIK